MGSGVVMPFISGGGMKSDFDTVLEMSQLLIQNEIGRLYSSVTSENIIRAIDRVLGLKEEWRQSVDREDIIKILTVRLSLWLDPSLKNKAATHVSG